MNLDERGHNAAVDLLERATMRPRPTVDELVRPERSSTGVRRRALVLAVVGVAAAVAAVALLWPRDAGLPTVTHPAAPLPVPAGVEPRREQPVGLGVSFEVPASWTPASPRNGVDHGFTDGPDAYVATWRMVTMRGTDPDEVVAIRTHEAETNLKAEVRSAASSTVDGRPAVVLTMRIPQSRDTFVTTEYDIDLGDGSWAVVAVGELEPEGQHDLLAWIASTITVGPSQPIWGEALTHPTAPLTVPDGVEPKTFAPEDLGFSISVPSSWQEPPQPHEFDVAIASPPGPRMFVLASRVASSIGNPGNRQVILEEQFHTKILETTDTVIDGHAAHISRFLIAYPDPSAAPAYDVEYDIDLGNGDFLWLAIGTRGGAPPGLLDWIRSTIRVQP